MAGNTLTQVVPQMLAKGLLALRENCVTPRLVNRGYEPMAGKKGSTVDVPIPSAIAAVAVTPGAYAPDAAALVPTSVPIVLDQWFEAPFDLSDREIMEVDPSFFPSAASEAIKSIANTVDRYVLGLYPHLFGFVGTPGTVPFNSGTVADASALATVLNVQTAPQDERYVVLDAHAEGSARNLPAFNNVAWNGRAQTMQQGTIATPTFGFGWWMNQNVPFHTAGTGTGYTVDGNHAAGVTAVAVEAGSGTFERGDIITFSSDPQTYTVTADVASVAASISIQPALRLALTNGATVTIKASHRANIAFQRDCIALAMRPLADQSELTRELGAIVRTGFDPISGLALRLEVRREHKRLRWSYDVLFGASVIRPELGARLAG